MSLQPSALPKSCVSLMNCCYNGIMPFSLFVFL
jgi:hypothetical protein